jgi:hypothetical protein
MMTAEVTAIPYLIDRSADADRVIEYILDGRRRLAVLYGQRGSRRTELIRDWIIPRLENRREAFYGACDPELPRTVTGALQELSLEDALRRGGLVILGRMERCLSLPDREKQRRVAELLKRVDEGEFPGSLVLVVTERSLGQMWTLQVAAPSLMANMLEIPVVTFRDCLQKLGATPGASGLRYAPEAVAALEEESGANGVVDGVELARAVDQGFLHFKIGSDRVITAADCKTVGGVAGALDEYRKLQLETAAERWGPEAAAKTAELILSEVASALKEGTRPDLNDVALRLGVGEKLFQDVFQWLCGDGQLLRDDGNRQLVIVPAELRTSIEQAGAQKQRDVTRAWALLRDGARSWSQLGVVLPRKRLEEIEAVRELLPATDDEAALMVRSLLRIENLQDMSSIRYWLRRIRSRGGEIPPLMQALFADRAAVRQRAADLLAGFDEPDVRRQLHRVATEDPERSVRRAAVASLAGMQVDELWPLISQEARDMGSPYQENAVAALRLFHDERTITLLRELVALPDQPLNIRTEAIAALAALGTTEAMRSLVEIGLNDEDAEDRSNAAAALGSIESRERVREAVEEIRNSKVTLEQAGPVTVRRAMGILLRSLLSLAVVVVNTFLHGVALLALRRYRSGFLFLGIEACIYASRKAGAWDRWEILVLTLLVMNWLASQLFATRISIADGKRDVLLESRRVATRPPRWKLGTPFTMMLLVADLIAFFFVHGLAHALAGRSQRALKLFGLECFGIVCLVIGWFYFSGAYAPITAFPPHVSRVLLWIYVTVGTILFAGTFFWDVVPVFYSLAAHPRRQHGSARRAPLYAAIASNRWAAEYLLECAAAPAVADRRWARRVICRTAETMPSQQLIESLKTQPRRPRYLVDVLKRIKNHEIVQALGEECRTAAPRLKRWMVDVLAGRPNEASLEQLSALRSSLDRYGRLRYAMAVWHYRVRLWPSTMLLVCALLVPLPILAAYEADATMKNPARPVLRMVQAPKMRGKMTGDQLLETQQFLARVDTEDALDVLTALFRDSAADNHKLWNGGLKKLGSAVCSLPEGPANDPQQQKINTLRDELASVLIDGVKSKQRQAKEALSAIKESPSRCGLSDRSKKELVQAASALETMRTPEAEDLAIAALDASGDRRAVKRLLAIALQRTPALQFQRRTASDAFQLDQFRENAFREKALDALGQNPSLEAADALSQIANAKDTARDSRDFASKAQQLANRRYETMIVEANVPLDNGQYKAAYDAGFKLLRVIPEGQPHDHLIDLLGEATYQLALGDKTGSKEWADRAIEYLNQAKKARRLKESRKLSNTYAVRADYLKQEKHVEEAFADADRAIKEDPTSYLGYATKAWLLQQTDQFKPSLNYALTAIEKDATMNWSYGLLQNAYTRQAQATADGELRKQILRNATRQFEKLAQQHQDVMWPEESLAEIYHDNMSEFDPGAFPRSYDLYADMQKRFGEHLSADQKQEFDANRLESRFTTGRYKEVSEIGAQLDRGLGESSALRIPVNVYRYAALAMSGDAAAAEIQLSRLERLVSKLPKDFDPGWSYNGSLIYLRAQPRGELEQQVTELIKALQDTKSLPPAVIAANRTALRTVKLRASSQER